MSRSAIFAVVACLTVATSQPSWSYSFKDYVSAQGGCGAHRSILDIQLDGIATDSGELHTLTVHLL